MIKCQDKKKCNWSNYVTEGWGLTLDTFTYNEAGYLNGWTLCSNTIEYTGETIEDLISTLNNIKVTYDLKVHDEHTKDILVIYTDDINKLYYFLYNYGLTDEFTHYFQILDNIEFRACWDADYVSAKEIAEWADLMINMVFVPDKYFYITSSQIPRKRIKKSNKAYKETIAQELYPISFDRYHLLRKAFFGGILYVPYPGLIISEPVIEIDLKSAYIYCLLAFKHCMSVSKRIDTEHWEYYVHSENKTSYGRYRIKYSSYTNKITCYKNENGEPCQKGEDIVDTFIFTADDLKLFLREVSVNTLECLHLDEYTLDYLPQSVRDELVDEYVKKEKLAKEKPGSGELAIQKVIINSIFGNCCRNWKEVDEFKEDRKDATLAPQWGIWTTSYCKSLLLGLGNSLEGWLYSATDSIYCLDTKENREKIAAFNEKIRERTKVLCDTFGYNYEDLKDLGTFCVKTNIKKFKAFGPNAYIYEKEDGNICIKASCCTKKYRNKLTKEEKEALFEVEQLPTGERYLGHLNLNKTSCIVEGKTYTSNGSYYYELLNEDETRVYALAEVVRRMLEQK